MKNGEGILFCSAHRGFESRILDDEEVSWPVTCGMVGIQGASQIGVVDKVI